MCCNTVRILTVQDTYYEACRITGSTESAACQTSNTHQSRSAGSTLLPPPLAERRLAALAGSSTVAKLPKGIVCTQRSDYKDSLPGDLGILEFVTLQLLCKASPHQIGPACLLPSVNNVKQVDAFKKNNCRPSIGDPPRHSGLPAARLRSYCRAHCCWTTAHPSQAT